MIPMSLGEDTVPTDAYFGLVLMAVVLIGAIVMTTIVIARNRREKLPPGTGNGNGDLPPHPG